MRAVQVLLVDDEESMRMISRRFLESFEDARGIVITEAKTGEEAIELLKRGRYDCILTDYRVGGPTGLDILAFAREHHPKALRVLMSGLVTPSLASEANAGPRVHELIEKPMTVEAIGVALRTRLIERYFSVMPTPD